MGKFTDTTYTNTIDSLVSATSSKVNNPYYIFMDKKPTKVTYYIQNVEQTTLDNASLLYGEHIGNQSPIKFNKINDFCLYDVDQISVDYDVSDFGTEAAAISGDAYILPNTISPKPGDFFRIDYIKEPILFKVNAVTPDTLDNGANIYKIEYMLEKSNSNDSLEAQVIKEYNFMMSNVGTEFKCLLESSEYELGSQLETLVEQLISCFTNIFFDSRLQTFVYTHNGYHIYDPYLIEFFIRNNVMSYGDSYTFVDHATTTNRTFAMDYMYTIFRKLEEGNIGGKVYLQAVADLIRDPNSLFVTRMDYYYKLVYNDNTPYKTRFYTIPYEVIDAVQSGTYYDSKDTKSFYNLWIAYFNGNTDYLTGDLLSSIRNADYMDNMEYFYGLAITIYILQKSIENLLT